MSEGKERLSLLLDDPTSLAVSLQQVARVVAEALNEHPADAGQRVRYGGGFVVRDVPEAVARQIARGLAQHGVGSFLVPRAAVKPAPRPKRAGALLFDQEGLGIGLPLRPDKVTRRPWSEVRALHAHALSDDPGSEEREALPRRGGNLRDLSPDTRGLINEIREVEEKERTQVRLGLDLLVGADLYRIGVAEPGAYAALELPALPEGEVLRGGWQQVADAGDAVRGKWIEWEGTIAAADARAGVVEVSERPGGERRVRLRLADPGEVRLRRLAPGATLGYRGRVDGWDGEVLLLGDAALRRASHSLENYLLLLRRLLRTAPASVMIPPTTRRFAERASVADLLYAKREELDAFNQWIGLALAQGIRFGEAEELGDEGLVDADEAELTTASPGEEAEELSDAELEDTDPRGTARARSERSPAARGSGEVSDVMQHFANTGRLDAKHVKEILSAAAELETLEEESGAPAGAPDPEVTEAMSFFDQKSGQWRLRDVLSGQEELEKLDEDLEGADRRPGES